MLLSIVPKHGLGCKTTSMAHFINLVLPIPLERNFTYSVTPQEAALLKPGMRVSVPFGKSKIYTGIVLNVHTIAPEVYEAKEIHQILDDAPIATEIQLKHWQWIADYYMCTLGEVVRSALPSAFLLESETLVLRNMEAEVDEEDLKDDEFLVYEALQHQSVLKVHEVAAIVDRKNVLPILNRLLEKNVIKLKEEVFEQYKPKLVKYIRLGMSYMSDDALETLLESLTRAPKQSQVVLALFQLQAITKKPIATAELEQASNSSKAVIKSLVQKEILEEYSIRVDRVDFDGTQEVSNTKELNEYQELALKDIKMPLMIIRLPY